MDVVHAVIGRASALDPKCGIDPLVLTSEERAGGHFVAETASGRVVRVSLERGLELNDGDVLAVDGLWAIVVKAAPEDLLLVEPGDDAIVWWAACYQPGNLHRPARFLPEGVLTPDDPMARSVLSGLGAKVTSVRRPFVGRRFGAAGAHHHHHDHGDAAGRRIDPHAADPQAR